MLLLRIFPFFLAGLYCFAIADVDPRSELKQISAAISGLERSLRELSKERLHIEQQIQDQRVEAANVEQSRISIQKSILQIEGDQVRLSEEASETLEKVEQLRIRLRERIRALYLSQEHKSGIFQVFGKAASGGLKAGIYLEHVHRYDENSLGQLQTLINTHSKKSVLLHRAAQEHQILLEQRQAEELRMTAILAELDRLAADLERTRVKNAKSLEQLIAKKSRVEDVLASLTRPKSAAVGQHLGGLLTYSRWPVEGEVVRKYGKYKVAGFTDEIFHKGVSFLTVEDAPVRVLEDGVVKFVGEMPDYGLVIIVHHGERDYSLYGKIGVATVSKGDVVKKGTTMGRSLGTKAEGGNFYFEVRRAGKALNPETVVKRG
jgi:septal ring factor EnvC (AmiA/AmiB activator)